MNSVVKRSRFTDLRKLSSEVYSIQVTLSFWLAHAWFYMENMNHFRTCYEHIVKSKGVETYLIFNSIDRY